MNGVVWYIRNGTVKRAGNESQGWARAVVDFPVPYHRDIARVRELMPEATAAIWEDRSWQDVILEAVADAMALDAPATSGAPARPGAADAQ